MGCPAGIVGRPFIITPLEIYFKITIGILYVCLGYIRFLYRKPYQQVKKTILYRIHLKREKKLVAMVAWGFNVPYIVYLFTPWFDGATLQIRISDEEKMMINWFGDEYWLYKNKTGMFLPKWHLQKPY